MHLNNQFLTFFEDIGDGQATFRPIFGIVLLSDFFKGQETVAFSAIVHKRGFQAGLDPSDLAFVNIGFLLLVVGRFDIKIVKFLAIDQGNPDFFGLGCVDQHSFHRAVLFLLHCLHGCTANLAGQPIHAGLKRKVR